MYIDPKWLKIPMAAIVAWLVVGGLPAFFLQEKWALSLFLAELIPVWIVCLYCTNKLNCPACGARMYYTLERYVFLRERSCHCPRCGELIRFEKKR